MVRSFAQTVDVGHGRGRLSPDAAASLWRIDAQLGRPCRTNSLWRDPVLQAQLRAAWLAYAAWVGGYGPWAPVAPYALPPDQSVHCEGDAMDTNEYADPAVDALLIDNGWIRTALGRGEPWHRDRIAALDKHRGGPAGGGANPFPIPEEGLTVADIDKLLANQKKILASNARIEAALARQAGTGRFFKNLEMARRGLDMWLWLVPGSEDFVRIRDRETAGLYKELNGGATSKLMSSAALKRLIADQEEAGGRDLSAKPGTTQTAPTSDEQKRVAALEMAEAEDAAAGDA